MPTELYRRHRPRSWDDLIGQDEAVKFFRGKLVKGTLPHALLLVGSSGTGKTTAARILRRELGCGKADYSEINCARSASMEMVQDIDRALHLAPMSGKCRVWYLDEAQSMSRVGFAQQAMLKMLEDVPEHVYFVLAAMDPGKLHRAVLTRCQRVDFRPVAPPLLRKLVADVLAKEKAELEDEVLDRLAAAADGSPRMALQLAEKVLELDGAAERLKALAEADTKGKAWELVRALVVEPAAKWDKVAAILRDLEDDPETLRRQVLGLAAKVLSDGGRLGRAYQCLVIFETPFYETGKPGLWRACYELFRHKD